MKNLLASVLPWLLQLGPAVSQDPARLARVEISAYLVAPTSLPTQGELLLRSLEQEEPPRRFPLSPMAPLSLGLPAGSVWEVAGEVPGFWVRRKTLTVGNPGQVTRVSLGLWPLGTISGTVKVQEKGFPRPARLRMRTLETPAFLGRPAGPPGSLDCPVDREGSWSCSLPAATFDLVLSAEGLTPVYRWAVEVPAGKALRLGTIELERGASVAGWVAVEGGAIEAERCVARLAPLVAAGADLRASADLERTAIERPVRKDGFFQITGLSPGAYSLEVRQPGYAPAKLSPVRVEPAAETFLREPLVLTRPLDLAFEISPPLDWLGKPWSAHLVRDAEDRVDPVVFEGLADREGRLTVPGLTPGRYRLSVRDSLDNRLHSSDDLQLDGPAAGPRRIEIDLVDLEGRVRLGREPLRSTLWFGGKGSVVNVEIETDAEGRFIGVLPREGLWILDVEAGEPSLRSRTRVDVQAGWSGLARLDVLLPDTRLFGHVRDEEGNPAAGVDVIAAGEGPEQWVQTDSSGSFELRGIDEGLVRLMASAPSRASDPVAATLAEGRAVGPLDLRLRKLERLTGEVLSSRGPVPGARVLVGSYPATGGGAVGTTGTDGAFSVELPPGLPQLVTFVSAPGFSLRALGPLKPGDLRLEVTEEGGTLEVALPAKPEDLVRNGLSYAVFANGHLIPTGLLRQWAIAQGEPWATDGQTTLRFPRLAPGEYRVCLFSRAVEVALAGALPAAGPSCDSGLLSPGATLPLAPVSP